MENLQYHECLATEIFYNIKSGFLWSIHILLIVSTYLYHLFVIKQKALLSNSKPVLKNLINILNGFVSISLTAPDIMKSSEIGR